MRDAGGARALVQRASPPPRARRRRAELPGAGCVAVDGTGALLAVALVGWPRPAAAPPTLTRVAVVVLGAGRIVFELGGLAPVRALAWAPATHDVPAPSLALGAADGSVVVLEVPEEACAAAREAALAARAAVGAREAAAAVRERCVTRV